MQRISARASGTLYRSDAGSQLPAILWRCTALRCALLTPSVIRWDVHSEKQSLFFLSSRGPVLDQSRPSAAALRIIFAYTST